MRAGWPYTLLLIAVLTAGWSCRTVSAQESRDRRRSSDDSRDWRRSSEESRDRRSTAEVSRSPSGSGFDVFRILEERNIFDPQRRPMVRSGAPAPPSPPSAPIAESFALQGVLLDTSEAVAFFEGSSPEFNAAVNLGGIIGGHKLVEIRTDRVTLASTARKVELPVTWQMSRRAGGEWEATTATTPFAGSPASLPTLPSGPPGSGPPGATVMSPGSPAPAPGSPAPAGGSADDMLKRLMERRRKEMGQ